MSNLPVTRSIPWAALCTVIDIWQCQNNEMQLQQWNQKTQQQD